MLPALDAREIIAERTCTIDQIKRLYAVVMGYAVTTCFSSIYIRARNIGFEDTIGPSIILALRHLRFADYPHLFGSQRLLDTRYPQAEPGTAEGNRRRSRPSGGCPAASRSRPS